MYTLRLQKIDGHIAAILPAELVEKLAAGDAESLHVLETPAGLMLRPKSPDVEPAVEHAKMVMARYDGALRELAK